MRAQGEDGAAWGYSSDDIHSKLLSFSSSADGEIPRAVIFHDSFFEALAPFLAQHFQRAVYSWRSFSDPTLIQAEHPDLVIDEISERFLFKLCRKTP